VFIYLFFEFISFFTRLLKLLKLGACFIFILYFALFLITYLIIHDIQLKIQDFSFIIRIEKGLISRRSIRAIIYAKVIMLFIIVLSIII
jgi:hypothetical protein